MKDPNEISLKELKEIPAFGWDEEFNSLIIVPSEEIHDSGYRCMRAVLVRDNKIVGAIGGWSDVINPNGIGNRGDYSARSENLNYVPSIGLSIDCLKESKCIRLIMQKMCKMEEIITSNMCFYAIEK